VDLAEDCGGFLLVVEVDDLLEERVGDAGCDLRGCQ
jgi:hypothetical protein